MGHFGRRATFVFIYAPCLSLYSAHSALTKVARLPLQLDRLYVGVVSSLDELLLAVGLKAA
jgi:hypothetical protein